MDKRTQINHEIIPRILKVTMQYDIIIKVWKKFISNIKKTCETLNSVGEKQKLNVLQLEDKPPFEIRIRYFDISLAIKFSTVTKVIYGQVSFGKISHSEGKERFNELDKVFITEQGNILKEKNDPYNALGHVDNSDDVSTIFLNWIVSFIEGSDQIEGIDNKEQIDVEY